MFFVTWLSVNVNGKNDSNDHADGCDGGQGNHVGNHLTTFDSVRNHFITDLKLFFVINTVKLGYDELGYNEYGYNEHSVILNTP